LTEVPLGFAPGAALFGFAEPRSGNWQFSDVPQFTEKRQEQDSLR
jgi:hypothetical protein